MKNYILIFLLFFIQNLNCMQLGSPLQMQDDIEKCIICFDELYTKKSDVIVLSCSKKHAFHIECINEWKKKAAYPTCPNCRNMMADVPNSPAYFANYDFPKKSEYEENLCSCTAFMSAFFDEQ